MQILDGAFSYVKFKEMFYYCVAPNVGESKNSRSYVYIQHT